jgi:hypothetical protein
MEARREFLTRTAGFAAAFVLAPRGAPLFAQPAGGVFTPEMFGAKGDGVANDSAAFKALADAVNANGGGTVRFRRTTYLVGAQQRSIGRGGWAYTPADLLDFRGCSKPLIIEGNGATIRCAPGLRYGTFDRLRGTPTKHNQPYYEQHELATPYRQMILVADCTGPVVVSDLELDGNLPNLRIGGPFGDTGWQIPAFGLSLTNNRGSERVSSVYTHHHGLDGLYIDGLDRWVSPRPERLISNVRSEYNGRQGCSIVGGRGYAFRGCRFDHTGRSAVTSAPAAGVDIEAEGGKQIRDLSFTDCRFADNAGCGMVADVGDSEGATFTGCTFIGTTSWSAWPAKPRFRFHSCTFVGSAVNAYPHKDPQLAAQFHECRFRDDPRLSPTGKVALNGKKEHPIVDLGTSDNVLFSRCSFILTHGGLLPWSWRATYSNCTMQQRSPSVAFPKGKYLGYNRIDGRVDLYNSKVLGTVVVNGTPTPKGLLGGEAW